MSESNSDSEGNERKKANSDDSNTRDFIHEKFPTLTYQQVSESVRIAGPVKADICKYIKEKYKI